MGTTGAFEILSIDPERKRIGVALVDEGSSRAGAALPSRSAIVPGARLAGKVERHEAYGVFVFLAPGIAGLVPSSETGVPAGADVKKALPPGADVDVIVLEVDATGRRIRLSCRAVAAAQEAEEAREYAEARGRGRPSRSDRSPTSCVARSSRGIGTDGAITTAPITSSRGDSSARRTKPLRVATSMSESRAPASRIVPGADRPPRRIQVSVPKSAISSALTRTIAS